MTTQALLRPRDSFASVNRETQERDIDLVFKMARHLLLDDNGSVWKVKAEPKIAELKTFMQSMPFWRLNDETTSMTLIMDGLAVITLADPAQVCQNTLQNIADGYNHLRYGNHPAPRPA